MCWNTLREWLAGYLAARRLDLALFWRAREDLGAAHRHALSAVRLATCSLSRRDTGPRTIAAVRALTGLGDIERRRGEYPAAGDTLQYAWRLAETIDPPAPTHQAAILTQLGILAKEQGCFDEARDRYAAVGELYDAHGASPAELAMLQHNLAGLAYAQQRHATAEGHARWALSLRHASGAAATVEAAADTAVLAAALAGQQKHEQARELLLDAMAWCGAARPPQRYEIAVQAHILADVEQSMGNLSLAEDLYRHALSVKERLLGQHHPEIGVLANNLGTLLQAQGRWHEAVDCYRRALAITSHAYATGHPATTAAQDNLAKLLGRTTG